MNIDVRQHDQCIIGWINSFLWVIICLYVIATEFKMFGIFLLLCERFPTVILFRTNVASVGSEVKVLL